MSAEPKAGFRAEWTTILPGCAIVSPARGPSCPRRNELMKRPHRRSTATAFVLTTLLVMGAAGPSVAAIACVCPDGQVEIETAVCSCCSAENLDNRPVASEWELESSSCSDCVDIPMRVLPLKNDRLHLQSIAANTRDRVTPLTGVTGFEVDRPVRPNHGHRPTLALLSSVVLLT